MLVGRNNTIVFSWKRIQFSKVKKFYCSAIQHARRHVMAQNLCRSTYLMLEFARIPRADGNDTSIASNRLKKNKSTWTNQSKYIHAYIDLLAFYKITHKITNRPNHYQTTTPHHPNQPTNNQPTNKPTNHANQPTTNPSYNQLTNQPHPTKPCQLTDQQPTHELTNKPTNRKPKTHPTNQTSKSTNK